MVSRYCLVMCGLVLLHGCKKDEPEPEQEPEGQPELAAGDACDPTVERIPEEDLEQAEADAEESGEELPAVCAPGLACEPVADSDADYVCGTALEIRGRIADATTDEPIEGALVAALDDTGAPVTDVVSSDACGNYVLPMSVRRDANGEFAETPKWTLTVSAQDYLPFPEGARPALPLDIAQAVPDPDPPPPPEEGEETEDEEETEVYVTDIIENAASSVSLIPLPADEQGGATIRGTVGGELAPGTLVVAEGAQGRVPYGIADASGAYTLFNVSEGDVTIRGYRRDLELEPATVSVSGGETEGVDLAVVSENTADLATVSGSLNIVNAEGGLTTSVVLVPTSVYLDALERGPVPVGLRVPDPPIAPDVSSDFRFAGVPSGTYKVLVAFENDRLVRDPDEGIAGTAIQEITVGRGEETTLAESFKVTEALGITSPGSENPETVDGAPEFIFDDDSSEDGYELVVLDALGEIVWETELAGVSGSDTVNVPYDGPALTEGMYYQFRVTSFRQQNNNAERTYISRTEDLRGVFVFGEPAPAEACMVEEEEGGDTDGGTGGTSTGG